MLSYLATVAVRAAIKFAADHGPVEIGNATKVKCLSHSFIDLRQRNSHPLSHMFKRTCFLYFLFLLCMSSNLIWNVVFSVILQQEFANRLSILSSDYLQQLVKLLHTHSLAKMSALQVKSTLILVLSMIRVKVNYVSFCLLFGTAPVNRHLFSLLLALGAVVSAKNYIPCMLFLIELL